MCYEHIYRASAICERWALVAICTYPNVTSASVPLEAKSNSAATSDEQTEEHTDSETC
jgi:hypothetical protein